MNKRYWDRMAAHYEDEIFDSLANDRQRIVLSHLKKYAAPDSVACDVGCGIGKYLPELASRFKHVYAIDLSDRLLERARTTYADLNNITYIQSNLAKPELKIKKPAFAICMNVLIMPGYRTRRRILEHIHQKLVKGGHLLLMLPSLESALLSNVQLIEWNMLHGMSYGQSLAEGLQPTAEGGGSVVEGILEVDSVPTKHFIREEAIVTLRNIGFSVLSVEKVEYDWNTEFDNPPPWMQDPHPWDWLFVLKKP